MHFPTHPIQFGWTNQQISAIDRNPDISASHPLKMHIKLTQADIIDPKPVAKIIANHLNPGLNNSRAFAVENTLNLLKTPEAVYAYTQKLLVEVQNQLKPIYKAGTKQRVSYLHPVTKKPVTVARRESYALTQSSPDMSLKSADSPFHYDNQEAEIFTLVYGCNQNITQGGHLAIADLEEAKVNNNFSVTNQNNSQAFNSYYTGDPIDPKYIYELDYLDLDSDMPIVFLNNKRGEGVAHRGKPFTAGNNPVRPLKTFYVRDWLKPL